MVGKNNNELGRLGEDAALEYLLQQGLSMRDRNWRSGHLELDLIMEAPHSLRIVEVKTLMRSDGFDPLDNMTPAKIKKVVAAARRYISAKAIRKDVSFDVVTVVVDNAGNCETTYIPDAFLPIDNSSYY